MTSHSTEIEMVRSHKGVLYFVLRSKKYDTYAVINMFLLVQVLLNQFTSLLMEE